jgi:uroporphyrinogen III methyltransferase/synthase
LITRPAEQAPPFAEALTAAGAVPLLYPTITVAAPPSWQPLDDALARRDQYAWAVFTSPSAVAFTLARAAQLGLGADALGAMRIAAVGTQTARALEQRGLAVDLVPPELEQRQEGLIAALLAQGCGADASAARILFPQALGGRELLRDDLTRRGCAVDMVPVSRTVPCELSRDPPPPFDVATFASPSALRAFVRGLGADRLSSTVVAVIGPTTAEAAAALGVRVDVMPATPSVAALTAALVQRRAAGFVRSAD